MNVEQQEYIEVVARFMVDLIPVQEAPRNYDHAVAAFVSFFDASGYYNDTLQGLRDELRLIEADMEEM